MTEKADINNKNQETDKNPFAQDVDTQAISLEEEKKETIEPKEEKNEELEALNSENDQLKKSLDEKNSQYVRLAADFDNYRKRQAQERESLLKYGAEDTLKKLLPILDTFERAQKSMQEVSDAQQAKECFDAVQKQFVEAIEKIGLQKIETQGHEFDPNKHEAVMQTPTNDHPDHTIIAELQSGYKLHDKIIRPALVNVAVNE